MSKEKYINKKWLNEEDSCYTGHIVTLDDNDEYSDGGKSRNVYLLLADCTRSAKIHPEDYTDMGSYISKLKIIRDTVDEFINHLSE